MAIKDILLLGDERLYQASEEVRKEELDEIRLVVDDLHDTLLDFKARHGAGRGIAAPQIGVWKRLVYVHIDEPWVLINPTLEDFSDARFELWDDCMSFPNLEVKVSRYFSGTLKWRDLDWKSHEKRVHHDLSELFQHEIDHLDGVLAVERAINGKSFRVK